MGNITGILNYKLFITWFELSEEVIAPPLKIHVTSPIPDLSPSFSVTVMATSI